MKIQCDVCEKAPATVICCADEAALCAKCDGEVHAANKLASKHQRLLLQCLSNDLPLCDICQDKAAFIFCIEDRALFCKDCDAAIHSANSLAAKHQRYLATGIRVALSSTCNNTNSKGQTEPRPPTSSSQPTALGTRPQHVSVITSPCWAATDQLIQFSDYESSSKTPTQVLVLTTCLLLVQKENLEFSELDWLTDINLLQEGLAAAEVPQLQVSQPSTATSYRTTKFYNTPHKKPRIETPDDDEEHFTVPDLG